MNNTKSPGQTFPLSLPWNMIHLSTDFPICMLLGNETGASWDPKDYSWMSDSLHFKY